MAKKRNKPNELNEIILNALNDNQYNFQREVAVNNYSSDFFIETPSGGTAIFEVKDWKPTQENIQQASYLSKEIKKYAKTDFAYVIMPVDNSSPKDGIIAVTDVDKLLKDGIIKSNRSYHKKPSIQPLPKRTAFVAMPYSKIFSDTLQVAISPACIETGYRPIRTDKQEFTGDIVKRIKKDIIDCSLIISDLSENNPNVIYETGFAEGIQKPIILICSTPIEKVPFDINHDNIVSYEMGNTIDLRPKIKAQILALGL